MRNTAMSCAARPHDLGRERLLIVQRHGELLRALDTWKLVTMCPSCPDEPEPEPAGTSSAAAEVVDDQLVLVTKTAQSAERRNTSIVFCSSSVRPVPAAPPVRRGLCRRLR